MTTIKKNQFISLQNSYHGETLGALSVTDVALFRDAYGALINQNAAVRVRTGAKRSRRKCESFASRCAEALEMHLQAHHDCIAALIVEPLTQGAAGMAMYHPAYLTRARELCSHYGVHLIADEIAVGMGRTGTMFACEQAPHPLPSPRREGDFTDFLLLSKGITGGYLPLSIVMTTDEIYQAFYADQTARGFLHSALLYRQPVGVSCGIGHARHLRAGRRGQLQPRQKPRFSTASPNRCATMQK